MLGKKKCRILKEIRQRIADENEIPWVTRECTHRGECRGTCPRCESELRELERQLAARQAAGKRVAVAALCTGLAFSSVGCTRTVVARPDPGEIAGMIAPIETPSPAETPEPEDWQIMGEILYNEDLEGETELTGDVAVIGDVQDPADEPLPEGEIDG